MQAWDCNPMDKSGLQAATIGYNHPAHAKALLFSLNTACASYTEEKREDVEGKSHDGSVIWGRRMYYAEAIHRG
jgi:hypothetical protein